MSESSRSQSPRGDGERGTGVIASFIFKFKLSKITVAAAAGGEGKFFILLPSYFPFFFLGSFLPLLLPLLCEYCYTIIAASCQPEHKKQHTTDIREQFVIDMNLFGGRGKKVIVMQTCINNPRSYTGANVESFSRCLL